MPISVPIAPNQTLQKSAVALFKIHKMLRCLLESIDNIIKTFKYYISKYFLKSITQLMFVYFRHVISGLATYTQYLVSLQVINPKGAGPSSTVVVMTNEGGK